MSCVACDLSLIFILKYQKKKYFFMWYRCFLFFFFFFKKQMIKTSDNKTSDYKNKVIK